MTALRRYKLYNRRNKYGRRIYRMEDVAKKEGISRQAVYLSLRKFKEQETAPYKGFTITVK